MEFESIEQILIKHSEIEQEPTDLLEETKSDFTLDHIKEIIYNEEGQDDLTDVISMFDNGQGASELENIMDISNDALNYFPHKILNNLSPAEKIFEYQNKLK